MEIVEILAVIIFAAAFILIAVNKTPWFEIKRSYIALIGGLLMIIIGVISVEDAFNSIKFDLIFLLIGMMALVAGLEYVGFFTLVSNMILKHSNSKNKLMIFIMLASAFLSMIALNDAVVLMFTPIVIKCCIKLNNNPIPYLVGMLISSNLGSLALTIGNPQNAFIVSKIGMDFLTYAGYCLPIAIVCVVVAIFFICIYYRKKMSEPYTYDKNIEVEEIKIDRKLIVMIAITIITFIFFMLSNILGIEIWHVAIVAGFLSLFVVITTSIKDVKWVAERIDWHILLFFIGLFVIVAGIVKTGIISDIFAFIPGFGDGEIPSILTLTIVVILLSNIFSNVPAVILLSEVIPMGATVQWITLAASSTIAGNTTILGSAAGVIVAEKSKKYGIYIDYFRFLVIGILMTIVTTAVMYLIVSLIFGTS